MTKRWFLVTVAFSLVFVVVCLVYVRFNRHQFNDEMSKFQPVTNSEDIQTDTRTDTRNPTNTSFADDAITQAEDSDTQIDDLSWSANGIVDDVPVDHPLYGLTVEQAKAEIHALMAKVDDGRVDAMKLQIESLLARIPDTTVDTPNHPVFDYARQLMDSGWSVEQIMNDTRFAQLSNDMLNKETGVDKILSDSEERTRLSKQRIKETEALFSSTDE